MNNYETDIENYSKQIEKQNKEIESKNKNLEQVQSSIENLSADKVISNLLKEHTYITEKEIETLKEKKEEVIQDIEHLISSVEEEKNQLTSDYRELKTLESIGEDVSGSLEVLQNKDDKLSDNLIQLYKLLNENEKNYDDHIEKANQSLSMEKAKKELNEYMMSKNYGLEDYIHGESYSQDPKWRELHQKAYPDDKIPPFNLYRAIDRLPRLDKNTSFSEIIAQTNPNYDLKESYQVNCQRCVPTYEMRRRGYDVTAKPLPNKNDKYQIDYLSMWDNPVEIHCKNNGLNDIKEHMKKWGDGARAEISVDYKCFKYGHVFVAEQRSGQIVFIDPQTDEILDESIFNDFKDNCTSICRLDQLKPNSNIFDCMEEV